MEKCLSALGCELCSCVFSDGTFDLEKYLIHKSRLETLYWMLSYTTLEQERGRHLCKVCECKKCGKFYCESMDIPENKSGDSLLAAVYRWLYQDACHVKPEFVSSKDAFRKAFLKLFDDKDKPFVEQWLNRPENQSLLSMYRS